MREKFRISIDGKKITLFYIFLYLLFSVSIFLHLSPLNMVLLSTLVFFLLGYPLILLIFDEVSLLELILFSSTTSISLTVIFILFLNLIFQIPFDDSFIFSMLALSVLLSVASFYKGKSLLIKVNLRDRWIPLILFLSLVFRLILFMKIGSIMGTDVGRFAILSRIFYLEGKIKMDLRPYDLAEGWFYFPGIIAIPIVYEILGVDPITASTILGFVISYLSLIAFYFFVKEASNEKNGLNALIFYSFLFDLPLSYIIFTLVPYGMSFPYLYLLFYTATAYFFSKEKKNTGKFFFLFTVSIFGCMVFHAYSLFLFVPLLFSFIAYEIIEKSRVERSMRVFLQVFRSTILSILLLSPFLCLAKDYIFTSTRLENLADLGAWPAEEATLWKGTSVLEVLSRMLFSNPAGITEPVFLFAASIVSFLSVILIFKRKKKEKVIAFFFLFVLIFNFFSSFGNANSVRFLGSTSLIYPILISDLLPIPQINLLISISSIYIKSPSVLYYIRVLEPPRERGAPIQTMIWPEFWDAMRFIKENVPENATFFIDGYGAGCIGASSSYGERIFPITSRKIFFFTDYCWAQYNKSEYERRLSLYRRICIDPTNETSIRELKGKYNVTHVYVGPKDLCLNVTKVLNSPHYELIFHEKDIFIFRIK